MIGGISNLIYTSFIKLLLKYGIDDQNRSVKSLIEVDLLRCLASTETNKLNSQILSDSGFRFLFFLRLASKQPKSPFKKRVHALSYLCHKKYFYKYGYQIPISTKIGRGFQLLHFGNIVFNPATIIGNNVLIAPGAFINKDVPDDCLVIGNPSNVFIKTSDIINGYIVNRVNIYD